MPALSPTMTTGNLLQWVAKEGDLLTPGDLLAEIETDKASVGFEVQEEGYLAKILVSEGTSDIPVGGLLCIMVEEEEDIAKFKDYTLESANAPQESASAPKETQESAVVQENKENKVQQVVQQTGDRVFISPLARKTALNKGIAIESLRGSGTGPNGRVIEKDVLSYKAVEEPKKVEATKKEGSPSAPAPKVAPAMVAQDLEFRDIPLTSMRKIIANRLLESKNTIPHYYLSVSVEMDEVLAIRGELNKEEGVKISVNDMIVKAAALSCIKVKEVNSQWRGDSIREFANCDVSIAVSTDAGLITPIVFNANQKGLATISADTKELAGLARQSKLKPAQFTGGTFTISNLGMMGVENFTAVINPPQSCILAVGATTKQIVFCPENSHQVKSVMKVTLSCDHRVVDGAVGAKWL